VKSCPLDPALAVVLKECWSVLLPVMTKIVNLSIDTPVLPIVLSTVTYAKSTVEKNGSGLMFLLNSDQFLIQRLCVSLWRELLLCS